ncbi:MAG: nucleoid-associated protein [Bacteroidia bacterium]
MAEKFEIETTQLEKVSVHQVGNKTNNEDLIISKDLLGLSDEKLKDLLMKFFVSSFSNPEFYNFSFSNNDFTLNPIYSYALQMFEHGSAFHINSINIAKHLYELSTHPQIKSGDLFIAYFANIQVEDEDVEAIGIFKSENKYDFLKLNQTNNIFDVSYNDGINIDKLDKGCLIFNTNADQGYKVCIIDKGNKGNEAQYWKDSFLQLKPCSNNYNHTKEFMNIAKNFVTKQLNEEFEVSKADQIDYLNRSVDYFKTNDTFDKQEFEQAVFKDEGVIESFRTFDEAYRMSNELDISDSFDISSQAVKKQARIFKSVLKLDKNFHIYIHGNRNLIEQGVEEDGRKFYKLYFKEEE